MEREKLSARTVRKSGQAVIDLKKLAELRGQFKIAGLEGLGNNVTEMFNTIESLWKENAELKSDVKAGAHMLAKATDRINDLEAVAKAAEEVMKLLSENGASIVPHIIDTDDNPGQRLRNALAALKDKAGLPLDRHRNEPRVCGDCQRQDRAGTGAA